MVKNFLQNCLNYTGLFPRKFGKRTRREFLFLAGGMFIMGKYLSPHFTEAECNCNGTGRLPWDDGLEKDQFMAFLELLEAIRKEWGSRPIVVNSFYRSLNTIAKFHLLDPLDPIRAGVVDLRLMWGFLVVKLWI